jgi:hypothetical protein
MTVEEEAALESLVGACRPRGNTPPRATMHGRGDRWAAQKMGEMAGGSCQRAA